MWRWDLPTPASLRAGGEGGGGGEMANVFSGGGYEPPLSAVLGVGWEAEM